jgi:spermidine synthase
MPTSYGGPGREERPRVRVDDEGETRTLVVDETFASFYRPGEVATRCVWDAIAAPLLWLPPARRRRILVIGLGGGSVARIARALAPSARITGLELDAGVVGLARQHFDLDALDLDVEIGDALGWLERHAGGRRRYDAILEDVFVGEGDGVHKPDWIPDPAHEMAFSLLAPGGVFVSNTLDEHAVVARALRARFEDLVEIETEDYDNRVLAAAEGGFTGAALRRRVAASPVLAASLPILRFRTRG